MAFGAIIPQVRILSAQRGILITRIPFFCLKFFLLQFRSDRIRTGTSARSEKGPWKAPSASEGGAEGADRKSASDAPNPVGPERNSHYENSFFLFKIFLLSSSPDRIRTGVNADRIGRKRRQDAAGSERRRRGASCQEDRKRSGGSCRPRERFCFDFHFTKSTIIWAQPTGPGLEGARSACRT